jgi:hypothetical protein
MCALSIYFNKADNSNSWHELQLEYKNARAQLVSLKEEFGDMSSMATSMLATLDAQYQHLVDIIETSVPFSRVLTSPLPPPINRSKVRGLIAYRAWNTHIKGRLSPCIVNNDLAWKGEVNFSDNVPTKSNTHGLHATRIEVYDHNSYGEYITGLVDCYGTVVEHADGVLRAECARVLYIMLTIREENNYVSLLTGAYKAFTETYPNATVCVVSPFQRYLIIAREILISQGGI